MVRMIEWWKLIANNTIVNKLKFKSSRGRVVIQAIVRLINDPIKIYKTNKIYSIIIIIIIIIIKIKLF